MSELPENAGRHPAESADLMALIARARDADREAERLRAAGLRYDDPDRHTAVGRRHETREAVMNEVHRLLRSGQ